MKKYIYFIFCTLALYACTSNTIFKKPDDLIPEDQMVDILVDMQLAIAAQNIKNSDGVYGLNYMQLVYDKYQIDSTRFSHSSFYYNTNIDRYNELFKNVETRLIDMKKEKDILIDSLDAKEQKVRERKNDSIKKARSTAE